MTSKSFFLDNVFLEGLFLHDKSDIYPPNRITDLVIIYNLNYSSNLLSNNDNLQATLSWTSPGNDFNKGRSAYYEIRCLSNPKVLADPLKFQQETISVPKDFVPLPLEAGTLQKATVNLPWPNEVFYYAIVAVDNAGNRGEVSNLVPVFAEEVTTTPANVSNELNMVFQVVDSQDGAREALVDNNTIIYLVSAAIAAFLLILISIFIVAVCRARKKQKLTTEDISSPIHPSSSNTLTRQTQDFQSLPYSQSGNNNGYYHQNTRNTGPVSMLTTGTDPSLMTGLGSTSLPDVTLAEHQKTFTTNDSTFGYYDVWKYHHSELQPSPVRSEEEATTVDTYVGNENGYQSMSLGHSMGYLLPSTSQDNSKSHPKHYLKPFQAQNSQFHQPRSLNMHSTSLHGILQDRAANSLLMTTTSKYTLNQNSSDSPKNTSDNPSNTSSGSQAPLSIFRGGRASSISTESPQATSSSGGDMSPPNDYFKKQTLSNQNGPESLNWALANASLFNGDTILKKSKSRGNTSKSKKENVGSSGKKNNVLGGNGSECGTSSTECGSDYSDQNSTADDKPIVYNVSTSSIVVPNCKNKIVIGNPGLIRSNKTGINHKVNTLTPTPAPRTSVSNISAEYKLARSKDSKLSSVKEAIDEEASWSYQERKRRQESLV